MRGRERVGLFGAFFRPVINNPSKSLCSYRYAERERERGTQRERCTERCGSPKILCSSSPAEVECVLRGVQLFVDVVLDSRNVESQCIKEGSNEKRETNVPILSFVLCTLFFRTLCCFVLFLVLHQSGDLISDLRSMHKPMKDWFLK